MLAANPPAAVTFGGGESSVTLTAATDDDAVVEGASVVTAAFAGGEGYAAAANAGSAQVSVEDNDTAAFTVTVAPEAIDEGESATLTVAISNGVTFAEDQAIALDFAGGTATKGTDYTVSAESVVLAAGSASVRATVTAVDDTDQEGAETVTVTARHGGAAIGSASVTIEASDAALPAISIAAGMSPVIGRDRGSVHPDAHGGDDRGADGGGERDGERGHAGRESAGLGDLRRRRDERDADGGDRRRCRGGGRERGDGGGRQRRGLRGGRQRGLGAGER